MWRSSKSPHHLPDIQDYLFTDDSLEGWEANWNDNELMGQWPSTNQMEHIDWLELEAILLALIQWDHSVMIMIRTFMCTAIQQWFTSRIKEAQDQRPFFSRWSGLVQHSIVPTRLPVACNVTADTLFTLSRPSPTKWRLIQQNVLILEKAWAVHTLSILWDKLGLVYDPHPQRPTPTPSLQEQHTDVILTLSPMGC